MLYQQSFVPFSFSLRIVDANGIEEVSSPPIERHDIATLLDLEGCFTSLAVGTALLGGASAVCDVEGELVDNVEVGLPFDLLGAGEK